MPRTPDSLAAPARRGSRPTTPGKTLFDKLWSSHVVADLGGGWSLLHVDRLLLHDLNFPASYAAIRQRGLPILSPELVFATPDHAVSSTPGRTGSTSPVGRTLYGALQKATMATGITLFDIGTGQQGIVHVIGPETALFMPGLSVAVGDSHTCTNGALGALAIGVGSSEAVHILSTQTLRLRKPRNFRIRLTGSLPPRVSVKDAALHLIRRFGTRVGMGGAIEFAGSVVEAMSIEERLTLCNLAVEMGSRFAVVAVDQATIDYVRGRPYAPTGAVLDDAVTEWRQLRSDAHAVFDKDLEFDISSIEPCITWGTSPEQVIALNETIPRAVDYPSDEERHGVEATLEYMGLAAGDAILGTPVQWVFIGSCNNSRLSDLLAAAEVVGQRQVAPGVKAWVVPGSEAVKQQAEQRGLDRLFKAAGFEWREPGCSLCAAANGEVVPPGERCVSTSNRNFVGRQGPRARTHLASPQVAAAAAIAGAIVDPRSI